MKKTLLLFFLFILGSCSYEHPEYEANKKLAEKWVETFETQNMELWEEVVSEDVVDVAPMYGMGQIDYAASKQIAEFMLTATLMLNLTTQYGYLESILYNEARWEC